MAGLFEIQKSYRIPLLVAVVLHALLVIAMIVSVSSKTFRWSQASSDKPAVVMATAIEASELQQHIQKIQHEQTSAARQQAEKLQAIETQRHLEQQRLDKLREAQNTLKKQQQAEAVVLKRQEAEAAQAKEKAAAFKKELADLKKQAVVREQQQKKQRLAAQQEKLQQQLLDQQLKAEQQQLKAAQQQADRQATAALQGALDKYRAQILQTIQNNWHPLIQDAQLYCQMLVHIAPGGVVTGVELVKSSGDAALDRTARIAILKSSPLPVPHEANLFEAFRQLRIKMSPQDIKGMG